MQIRTGYNCYTYQIKPWRGDWHRPHLPLPVVPEPSFPVAVAEVQHEEDGGHVAKPFDQVLNAEIGQTSLY